MRRVVDGDTLILDNDEYVNLIGVDAPVTKRVGKDAASFTRKLVEGKRVRLEFDRATAVIDHKDRYGRTLAYVFLEEGTLLNGEIIKQGYGFVLTRFPFARLEEFRRLETEAREERRGLWKTP
ncbi:MAG TPA: thermonuclease family protein [Candidatus Binatia bacterium]|nr:thermonuclease family protein [Candidatus Binatia bacterium]